MNFETMRAKLLADKPELLKRATDYLNRGFFSDPIVKHKAQGILQSYANCNLRSGDLDEKAITERQWYALAGFVAYVDAKDEAPNGEDREDDIGDGRQAGNGW